MVERQVTIQEPWGPIGDRLAGTGGVFDVAQQLYGQIPGYFPYQTTVGFSPQQELAMGLTQQRAMAGSPYESALQNYLTGALGQQQVGLGGAAQTAHGLMGGLGMGQSALGQMAGGGPNPYLDAMFGQAAGGLTRQFQEATMPGIHAAFGGAGRTGSGAHQAALGSAQGELSRGLGGLASQIYGGAYDADQARRLAAAQSLQGGALGGVGAISDLYGQIGQQQATAGALAPIAQQMEYGNLDRLMGVGGMVSDQARQQLQAEMDRFNYYQQAPYQQLQGYAGMLGWPGQPTGQQTTTGPGGGPGKFGSALGGAAAGAGVGAAFGGIGAPIGAGLGLLGGLLFG